MWSNHKYVIATYKIDSPRMSEAATAIARGQSVGNPTISTPYETPLFLHKYAARTHTYSNGTIQVAWPKRVFSHTSMSHLLSVLMGGQCDIDLIHGCRLVDLDFTAIQHLFPHPRYGLQKIRDFLGVYDRPLVGGIIKPKIGLTPQQMADVCKQMADGGVDFIKEDEILNDQEFCRFEKRVPLIAKTLEGSHVLYAPCITADGSEVWRRARHAREMGATAVHCNVWAGLGTYLDLRRHVDLPIFFQKSGDGVITRGPYALDYVVVCQLIHRIGCDFAHVGMYGGYLSESIGDLKKRITALQTTIPSFSCGMTPEIASRIVEKFGIDIMVTSGGWIHGQPAGITASVKALRRAVECASTSWKTSPTDGSVVTLSHP